MMKMEGLSLHMCHSQHFNIVPIYPLRFLFLIFIIIMSCLALSSGACSQPFQCGGHLFQYPFGGKNSGCGDPALQLDCDNKEHMPLININGYQYYLLEPFDHRVEDPVDYMEIVEINMWGNSCNPSASNHTTEFWSNPQFHLYDDYMNLSLWGECGEEIREHLPTEAYPLECNKSWYFSDLNLGIYCKSSVHLPVKKIDRTNRPSPQNIQNGFKIKWSFSKGCENCESRKALCIYDTSNPTQLSCELGSPGGSNTANKTAIALGGSVGGVVLMAAVALLCFFYVMRRKRPQTGGDYGNSQRSEMEADHPKNVINSLSIFPYQELEQATNFFDEKNELGVGGFGAVYLGKLADGRAVAVRRLPQKSSGTVEQLMNEVQILSSLSHPNLVRLYGCTPPQTPITLLVYEFVSNGTLSDHLHGSRRTLTGLPCAVRLNIAIETAQALAYLHSMNPPIFHGDVKSSSILLDEDFRAKVADFGLSRLTPVNFLHAALAPHGTPGYVDPEYHECFQLTDKSDVYSFGVVLVEIISAKAALDNKRNRNEISLANMAKNKMRRGVLNELVDPDLKIERNEEVKVTVAAVANLAIECLAIETDLRPTMQDVVACLREIKEMLPNP